MATNCPTCESRKRTAYEALCLNDRYRDAMRAALGVPSYSTVEGDELIARFERHMAAMVANMMLTPEQRQAAYEAKCEA